MRAFTEQDFDKMAERIVDRFMGGNKLADAAAAEAMHGELNPDQIARLVHSANTMAFLRLMEQQKAQGSPDMTAEFDPIDVRDIIQHLVGSVDMPHEEPHMEPHAEPESDAMPLPDETNIHMHGDEPDVHVHNAPEDDDDDDDNNDGPFPKGDKQKAKDKAEKKDAPKKEPPKKDETKEAAFRERRMRKLADVLEDQFRQAEWAFEDGLARLDACLRRAHGAPSMPAFEKDALALHGDDVGIVVLNLVRGERGLPQLEFEDARAKVAALADRHVVEDSEPVRIFDQLVKIATEASRLQRGAAHARALCS